MTRVRISLLLPLLAIAACQTERKPLTGFDKQPPGTIALEGQGGGNVLMIWPIFALPPEPQQLFQIVLNGREVVTTSDEGFYDYYTWPMQGWTGAFNTWLMGVPSGTYVIELVDSAGQSWGKSAPLDVGAGGSFPNPSGNQFPAVVFAHFDGQAGSWTIDPTTQDSDAATDEITVTNLVAEDVVVERCVVAAAARTSCTPVGTVAPGADLLTVETLALSSKGDHPALFIHLASDASQSYQRDLVQGGGEFGNSCQIERILVHGTRPVLPGIAQDSTAFAMSSCYGYASGGP